MSRHIARATLEGMIKLGNLVPFSQVTVELKIIDRLNAFWRTDTRRE
ncbi:hypothetical protein [Nitrosomonas sp. Nm33]|nr:hypothetical protein [Nitrosomonas sp. Nm33]